MKGIIVGGENGGALRWMLWWSGHFKDTEYGASSIGWVGSEGSCQAVELKWLSCTGKGGPGRVRDLSIVGERNKKT